MRARLLAIQRAAIDAALAGPGIVVEGRDIGSVVWPEAPVKVYLSADASARATRRAAEEGGSDVERTRESLLARDQIDSGRTVSPLVMAEGAVHIDTTAYSLDEVIDQVVALVGCGPERRVTALRGPARASCRRVPAGTRRASCSTRCARSPGR